MEKEAKQLIQVCELWENGVIVESVDGVILSGSKGAGALYGYTSHEAIGKKHSFLVPGDVNDDFLSILKRIKQGEPVARYDTIHLRKDYSRMTVSLTITPVKAETGNIIAFAIFIHNTADQAQEKELFTALTQSSPIGIFILNDGKLVYVNRPFERIVGYGINELINTETLQYVHPDDRELVTTRARAALKNGLCQPFEYRVITKTGQTKWILETIISIRYQGRRSALGNFTDITEIKRLTEETNQANERLTALVKTLERQQRESAVLTEMRDMLQACSKMEEIAPIIMGFMKKLFPFVAGRVVPVKQFPHRPRIRGRLG